MCREKNTHKLCVPLKITTKLASGHNSFSHKSRSLSIFKSQENIKEESGVTDTGGDSLSFRIIRKL